MSTSRLVGRLMRSTVLTGIAAGVALPAAAQQTAPRDEMLVTGSRIVREDLSAPSPVTVVTSEQLRLSNTVNNEQFLNSLPQVIPAFDSTSNNPGDGTATVDLRDLGTTRTLVLVDGIRFVGSGANGVVDLNNIPAVLVEQVEVVTGGASAVYGSDAIAGVVHFILKDDFEGVELNVSDEFTGRGDGNIFNISLTAGGNFADGRGNAVVSMSYTNREELFQGDRDFSSLSFFDPGPTGTEFISGGSSNVPGVRFRSGGSGGANFGLTEAQVNAVDPDCATNTCSGFFIDSNQAVNGLRFGTAGDPVTDLYNYAPANYLQLPQERYNISSFVTYQINDFIEFYGRGIFSSTVVDSQLAPTPSQDTLTINLDNPAIPPALLAIISQDATSLNGDGTADVTINKRYEEVGTRNSLLDSSTFQMVGGLRGDLSSSWNYDTFFSYSRSAVNNIQTGNISRSALQQGVLCDAGPTAQASGCTAPYVDIFGGPMGISEAGADFISRTGAIQGTIEQIQWVGTVSGTIDQLVSPFADNGIGLALGLEYRESRADILPDSVLGPDVAGFNQSDAVSGSFDTYEAFGEIDIPIIEGMPFIESFSINGAYRFSEYSTVGSTHTFGVGGDWEPIPDLRFRANFQRAVRAPNISELFAPVVNGFPSASDPCSGGTNGAFGANTNVQSCIDNGVPASQVGAAFQSNGQIEALFGGNPNLEEETAETLTIGMVWQPSFVPGMTLQVDYYDIEVQDAISSIPLQVVLNDCHLESGTGQLCGLLDRNPSTGEIARPFFPELNQQNIAVLRAEGIDFNMQYSVDAADIGMPAEIGGFTVQYLGNYTLTSGIQTDPLSPFIDCPGLIGPTCGAPADNPVPQYKHTAQFGWLYGPLTTSVRWRYIGGFEVGPFDGGPEDFFVGTIGSRNYLDVTLALQATENLNLTAGVQNINNADIPVLGSTVSQQANTFPATYEVLGRQIFVGATLRF